MRSLLYCAADGITFRHEPVLTHTHTHHTATYQFLSIVNMVIHPTVLPDKHIPQVSIDVIDGDPGALKMGAPQMGP